MVKPEKFMLGELMNAFNLWANGHLSMVVSRMAKLLS